MLISLLIVLISVLSMFIYFNYKNKDISSELEISYKKLWLIFEILLFVLVGISVDVKYVISSGFMPVVVLLLSLIVRSIGTYIALSFTKFNLKEKIFIIFSYLPKYSVFIFEFENINLKEQHIANLKEKEQLINKNMCPNCKVSLIRRKGKYGIFYSCPNFPRCSHSKK